MTVTEFSITDITPGDRRSPLRWAFSHAFRHRWALASLVSGALANAALAAAISVFLGLAFNAIVASPPDYQRLGWAALGIVLSQVVRSAWQLGRNFGAEVIGQRLERDARAELYASLLGKSMTFHSLRPVGEIMARATNDVRELNLMLNPGVNLIVGSGMFLLMPLFVAPTIHPQLLLTPLLFVVGYYYALRRYMQELNPVTETARRNFGVMNARLEEAIEGIETVKGAAREPQEVERFEQNALAYRHAFVRQGEIEARFVPLLLLGLAQTFAFLHSLLLYRAGLLDLGQVISYNWLILLFGFPTFVSLFAFSQVSLGLAGARRILELITTETELDHNPTGYAALGRGGIAFENVSFGYDEGTPVLHSLSFAVRPGQTIAVVGQTGAGKTSLIKLINRTYDVTSGGVKVDGVDVRDWNMESLRQQISIIEQDLFLFSRTIGENIAFGKPGATQAEIEEAARAAQAHEFILSFKDGYQTVVGERGVTLSGGQRQRLALARAFLTNPRILILDDSTSAIDSATEDEIQKAIFRAAEGRTTLLITHRLSQIRWADQIVVLRKGRIAAIGRHEQLMATTEAYRRIFARYQ
ncbi:MAG TPA: ABC transporter ATP-binding protein [Anaerolineales bacterium]|nr:ABC transporter ATP-binding protein [Anaerolineales bacterium]